MIPAGSYRPWRRECATRCAPAWSPAPGPGRAGPAFDGQHHSVDSSEMAFKIAGSMAFKDAMENAQAVLMEPIMTVTVTVPEEPWAT